MDLTITFLIEIGLVVVLLGVLGIAALVSLRRRDGSNGAQPRTRAEDVDREAAQASQSQREFLKSTGLGKNEEIKLRLYSPGEYRKELNGGPIPEGTLAAVKAYRRLEDEWLDLPPRQAADALDLSPGDYEADEEHEVLLLKKMPRGLPASAAI